MAITQCEWMFAFPLHLRTSEANKKFVKTRLREASAISYHVEIFFESWRVDNERLLNIKQIVNRIKIQKWKQILLIPDVTCEIAMDGDYRRFSVCNMFWNKLDFPCFAQSVKYCKKFSIWNLITSSCASDSRVPLIHLLHSSACVRVELYDSYNISFIH